MPYIIQLYWLFFSYYFTHRTHLILGPVSKETISTDVVYMPFVGPSVEIPMTGICWRDTDVLFEFFSSLPTLSVPSDLLASGSQVILNDIILMVNSWKENWSMLASGYFHFSPFQNSYWLSVLKFSTFLLSLCPPSLHTYLFSPSLHFFLSSVLVIILSNTVIVLLYSHYTLRINSKSCLTNCSIPPNCWLLKWWYGNTTKVFGTEETREILGHQP